VLQPSLHDRLQKACLLRQFFFVFLGSSSLSFVASIEKKVGAGRGQEEPEEPEEPKEEGGSYGQRTLDVQSKGILLFISKMPTSEHRGSEETEAELQAANPPPFFILRLSVTKELCTGHVCRVSIKASVADKRLARLLMLRSCRCRRSCRQVRHLVLRRRWRVTDVCGGRRRWAMTSMMGRQTCWVSSYTLHGAAIVLKSCSRSWSDQVRMSMRMRQCGMQGWSGQSWWVG